MSLLAKGKAVFYIVQMVHNEKVYNLAWEKALIKVCYLCVLLDDKKFLPL